MIILGNYQRRGMISIIVVNLSAFSWKKKKSGIPLNISRVRYRNAAEKLI